MQNTWMERSHNIHVTYASFSPDIELSGCGACRHGNAHAQAAQAVARLAEGKLAEGQAAGLVYSLRDSHGRFSVLVGGAGVDHRWETSTEVSCWMEHVS